MKAAILKKLNRPLEIVQKPTPASKDDYEIIRVAFAALNRRDLWIRKGLYSNIQLPAVLGSDGVGLNENGDRVLVNPAIDWGNNEKYQSDRFQIIGMPQEGFLAEKCAVKTSQVCPAPEFLTDEECASLPLAGLTAYRGLFTQGKLRPGQKVLITGVGGGVASMALQMAVAAGARVYFTTSSEEKYKKAMELGADYGVLYTDDGWARELREYSGGIDLIFDGAGGKEFDQLLYICHPGGKIVVYGGTRGAYPKINPARIFWKQLSIIGTTMGSDADFQKMLVYVDQHKIRPVIDAVFDLDNINDAFEHLENSNQFGKVVIKINEI